MPPLSFGVTKDIPRNPMCFVNIVFRVPKELCNFRSEFSANGTRKLKITHNINRQTFKYNLDHNDFPSSRKISPFPTFYLFLDASNKIPKQFDSTSTKWERFTQVKHIIIRREEQTESLKEGEANEEKRI